MALLKPVASTHPYPAKPAVAVVGAEGEGLSVVVEVEEDISPVLALVVCPSACPIDHSYAEEAAGIQAGSYRVLGRSMLVVGGGEEPMGLWKLLRRLSPGLRLRLDP